MLVLGRQNGEELVMDLNDGRKVIVRNCGRRGGGGVRFGIEAPQDIRVTRRELLDARTTTTGTGRNPEVCTGLDAEDGQPPSKGSAREHAPAHLRKSATEPDPRSGNAPANEAPSTVVLAAVDGFDSQREGAD